MKMIYIVCFLIIGSSNLIPQELNFNDMIFLYKNRSFLDKCDPYLAKKNFAFSRGNTVCSEYIQKNSKDEVYAPQVTICDTYIYLTTFERATFDYYTNIATQYGMKLTKSGVNHSGHLEFTYMSDKYYLGLTQIPVKGEYGKIDYMIWLSFMNDK